MLASRRKLRGFTLLELVLVSGLSGLMLTTWLGAVSHQLVSLDKRLQTARKTQQFNQLGLWLSQELEYARDSGGYSWSWNDGCLLYNDDAGVRLQNGMLQWRGGLRRCHQVGWLNLGDPTDYEITSFSVTDGGYGNGHLRLTALIEGAPIEWEYRFNGQLHFVP